MTLAARPPDMRSGPTIHVPNGSLPDELQTRIRRYDPRTDLGSLVKRALHFLPRDHAVELLDAIQRTLVIQTQLEVRVYRGRDGVAWPRDPMNPLLPMRLAAIRHGDMYDWRRRFEDYGVMSRRVITNAGIDFLVDAWQNIVELEIMKFHGIGTATTAEAATQTALTTEITTAYNPDNTRATGTTTEVAGTPTKFKTSGTNTLDGAATIEEHGVLSQAATGGGVLWDRSLTGTQTLSASDSLQTDYTLTANAGG